MAIEQPGDDEPEPFTCRLAIVCDGGPHQISELSSKHPLSVARVGECNACNQVRTNQTDVIRLAILQRLGLRRYGDAPSWQALPRSTKTALLAEERRRAAEGSSTANQDDAFHNPDAEAETEVVAIHDGLPGGDSGGTQTRARDGFVYALTHEDHYEGWVSIGKTRSPRGSDGTTRIGGREGAYNRSDPYRRYTMRHTVYVEDRHISESDAHAAAAAHETCEDSRGEWFQMPLESAIEILNEIGTPLENDD